MIPPPRVEMMSFARIRGWIFAGALAAVGRLGDRFPSVYESDARGSAAALVRQLGLGVSDPAMLGPHESSSWSQNGEDGVIAELLARLGTTNRFAVEVGSGDGSENCTRALLEAGWRVSWIEADTDRSVRAAQVVGARGRVLGEFACRDSVVERLRAEGCPDEPDVAVIDIDSDDVGILGAVVSAIRPRIVVVEYNAAIPPGAEWTVGRGRGGWDGTFRHGASLAMLDRVADRAGYRLVYTDHCGVNAFFVREDLCGERFGLATPAAALQRRASFSVHPFGHPRSRAALAAMSVLSAEEMTAIEVRDVRPEHVSGAGRSLVSFEIFNGSPRWLTSGGANAINIAVASVDAPHEGPRVSLPFPVRPGTGRRILLLLPETSARARVTILQEGVLWRDDLPGAGWVGVGQMGTR